MHPIVLRNLVRLFVRGKHQSPIPDFGGAQYEQSFEAMICRSPCPGKRPACNGPIFISISEVSKQETIDPSINENLRYT